VYAHATLYLTRPLDVAGARDVLRGLDRKSVV